MKQGDWNMRSARRLDKMNIYADLFQNPSSGLRDTERTRFVTDRQTDGQTDGRTDIQGKNNMSPQNWGRHNNHGLLSLYRIIRYYNFF